MHLGIILESIVRDVFRIAGGLDAVLATLAPPGSEGGQRKRKWSIAFEVYSNFAEIAAYEGVSCIVRALVANLTDIASVDDLECQQSIFHKILLEVEVDANQHGLRALARFLG